MLPSTKIKGINFSKKLTKVLTINDVALWKNDLPKHYLGVKLTGINRARGLDESGEEDVQMWPFSVSVAVQRCAY